MSLMPDTSTFASDIRTYPKVTERHRHDFVQVIVPICGSMELEICSNLILVEEGSYALLPPGITHDFESRPESRFLVVDVDQKVLATSAAAQVCNIREPHIGVISPEAIRFFAYLVSAFEHGDFDAEQRQAFSLSGLSLIAKSDPTAIRPQTKGLPRSLLDNIREQKNGSIEKLARKHGLSRSVLYRRCRETYGLSPKQFEMYLRMQKAKDMLSKTGIPISSIAYAVGYENCSSFSSAFANYFNLPPSLYRKEQKAKQ